MMTGFLLEVCVGGGGGGGQAINIPIPTEGSGMPTTRPKNGSPV